jgi:hypothetical protein
MNLLRLRLSNKRSNHIIFQSIDPTLLSRGSCVVVFMSSLCAFLVQVLVGVCDRQFVVVNALWGAMCRSLKSEIAFPPEKQPVS